jgi:hypothetical protein
MSKIQEKAKNYFLHNTEVNEAYATADGFLFSAKQSASAHAVTLSDKDVTTLDRVEKPATTLSDAEQEVKKVAADKKAALKKVAAAKKAADAKNAAIVGSDQQTSK